MEIPLDDNGYIPQWGDMHVSFGTIEYDLRVGYLSFGWHYHVHQDNTIELTRPPRISNSNYTISLELKYTIFHFCTLKFILTVV